MGGMGLMDDGMTAARYRFARTMIATGAAALTSRATGGNVLQGALTGATVHLFNGEGHIGQKRGCSGRPCVNRPSGERPSVNTILNAATGTVSVVGGVVLCSPPGNPACLAGAPMIASGVNDLIEAKTGTSGLEMLSEEILDDPIPGRTADVVLDFSGGSSALIKAPFKFMMNHPNHILDGALDVGTGAADLYKSIDAYQSR